MADRAANRWRATRDVLAHRNVRFLLTGMFFSSTGLWQQRIAQDWLMLSLTHSATDVGITAALQSVPTVLLSLAGGLAADRFPKRSILICTQTTMMVLSATLATLTLSGVVRPWQIWCFAVGVGTVFAFDLPARQAMVNDVVGGAQLTSAIGLTATANQVGALIGPALSGVLISAAGPGLAFSVTACMYMVPMTTLSRMRMGARPARAGQRGGPGPLRQVGEGLRYVARRREMAVVMALVGIFGVFVGNLLVTNAAIAATVFHRGASGYGLLSSAGAAGAIIGAVLAATRHRQVQLRWILLTGLALAALYVVASVAPGYYGYAAVMIPVGTMTITFMTLANVLTQTVAEDHVRGRVMALFNLMFIGGGAVGGPLIGAIDQYAGPRTGMLVGGLVPMAATLVIGLRHGRGAGLRRQVPGPAAPGLVTAAGPDLSLPDLSLPDLSLPDLDLPDLSVPPGPGPDLLAGVPPACCAQDGAGDPGAS